MSYTTAQSVIDQAKYLTGKTNLSDADALRLLALALNEYSYIALTTDGKAQVDDSEEPDTSRASTTLSSGANKVRIGTDFLTWSFVEVEDANGKRHRLTPFDQRFNEETTTVSTKTGRPRQYDFYGGVFYFDTYADQDYTVRAHYGRAFTHPTSLSATLGIPSIHVEYLAKHIAANLALASNDPSYTQLRNEQEMSKRQVEDFYRVRDEDMPQVLAGKMDIRR